MAADASLPGIIATVVSDRHGLCWSGAVGAAARDGNAALTPDHAFRIASVTKVFVAATALRLVEQRRLNPFAPASRWLSQRTLAALADNGHPVDAITPFQLLAHIAWLLEHG